MKRSFIIVCAVASILTSCQEKLQVHYSIEYESRIIKFSSSPGWQSGWNEKIVASLEDGTLRGYGYDNKEVTADSVKMNRESISYSAFEDEPNTVLLYPPHEMVGGLVESNDRYMDLFFFNAHTGLYQLYARVKIKDIEKLIGKRLEFIEVRENAAS